MSRRTPLAQPPPPELPTGLANVPHPLGILAEMNDVARSMAVEGPRWSALQRRHVAVAAELVLFAGLLGFDELMAGRLGLRQAGAGLSLAVVLAIVAVTLSRRRLPGRMMALTTVVIFLSAAHSAVAVLSRIGVLQLPVGLSLAEITAVGVMVGSAARRGTGWPAVALILVGGAVMTSAPFARTGADVDVKMFAVPGALIWGMALSFGLVLRDADGRHARALTDARRTERMRIARELHDLVTHHVTGIAVRAQAAQVVAARHPGNADHAAGYAQIEQAAAASLSAMRQMVGVLRADQLPTPVAGDIRPALIGVVGDDARATVHLTDEVERLNPGPDVSAALHWIALEAMTNVRRHACGATTITIDVRVDRRAGSRTLVMDVTNDGVASAPDDGTTHYGLTGMRERCAALGGSLDAVAEPGDRWRVTARMPVDGRRRDPATEII